MVGYSPRAQSPDYCKGAPEHSRQTKTVFSVSGHTLEGTGVGVVGAPGSGSVMVVELIRTVVECRVAPGCSGPATLVCSWCTTMEGAMSSGSLCWLKIQGAGHGSLCGGRPFPETGRVAISGLLVECLRRGGAFIGDPRIAHQALCIVFGIFQLAKIMVNPLGGSDLAVAAFQPVK